jgi:hypothetical protein
MLERGQTSRAPGKVTDGLRRDWRGKASKAEFAGLVMESLCAGKEERSGAGQGSSPSKRLVLHETMRVQWD